MTKSNHTAPGTDEASTKVVLDILQRRLGSYTDLHLTLEHAH